jgi:hypothetical protein
MLRIFASIFATLVSVTTPLDRKRLMPDLSENDPVRSTVNRAEKIPGSSAYFIDNDQ